MSIDLIRGRTIKKEGQGYYLFDTDIESLPGYYSLEPKKGGRRDIWAVRVLNHLEKFKDEPAIVPGTTTLSGDEVTNVYGLNSPILTRWHTYSFGFLGGVVRVKPQAGIVEIEITHPKSDQVCEILTKLMFRQNNSKLPQIIQVS